MPLGFLQGLVEGAGEQMETRRQQAREDADRKYQQRMDILERTIKGAYGTPTRRTVSEALQGIAELSEGPKRKKGFKARMTGEMEDLVPLLLERIGSGDESLYAPGTMTGEGGEQPYPGTPGIIPGPGAPGQGGEIPAGPAGRGGGMDQGQLPPPPNSGPQDPGRPVEPVAGAAPGFQRFAQPKPPTATQTEGRLAQANLGGAAQAAETGPLPAPPSQQQPQGQMTYAEDEGLFKSPEQLDQEAALRGQAQSIAAAQGIHAAYQYLRSQGADDSLARSLLDKTQDPTTTSQASRAPFGSTTTNYYNPADPNAPIIPGRPSTTGPEIVDATTGQPLPPGYVADRRSTSTSGGRRQYIAGPQGLVDPQEVMAGDAQVYNYPGDFTPAPGLLGAPIEARPTPMDPNREFEQAQRRRDGIQEQLDTIEDSTPDMVKAMSPEAPQRMQYEQQKQDAIAAGLAGSTFATLDDLDQFLYSTDPEVPAAGAAAPAPGVGAATGRPEPPPGGGDIATDLGWMGDVPIPDELEIDRAPDEQVLAWFFNNTAEGQQMLQQVGDPNVMYSASKDDPSFLDEIREDLMNMSKAIHAPR
jgi:hypothetical protein